MVISVAHYVVMRTRWLLIAPSFSCCILYTVYGERRASGRIWGCLYSNTCSFCTCTQCNLCKRSTASHLQFGAWISKWLLKENGCLKILLMERVTERAGSWWSAQHRLNASSVVHECISKYERVLVKNSVHPRLTALLVTAACWPAHHDVSKEFDSPAPMSCRIF